MSEVISEEDDFRQQIRKRLHEEHPDLVEHWLPPIDDEDPHGRLFGYPALKTCIYVRDGRVAAEKARQLVETLNPARWQLTHEQA